ncbi:MAG: NAD(P)/FAD-dependent oxidoreductase [Candidatus Marinimicrobia bacterium]|nr:NAD(P)/FAD-dependent oxidoreductase [Candidatus Neomarinimicrobiota bacterium]
MDYEVIIIGAGPAGISAALQLKRYDIPALLVEKDRIGGLLLNARLVENYPGFPDGIGGPQLVDLFKRQLEKHSISVMKAEITVLECKNDFFIVPFGNQRFSARYLVIATGTKPRKPDEEIHIPPELHARIYSEVYRLIGLKNKRILIIGAGDAAFDYALNLAAQNRVTICNRGIVIKALPLLVRQADANGNIDYRENTSISELFSAASGAVGIRCYRNGKIETLKADYLIWAIGREPQLDFLPESLAIINDHAGVKRNMYFIGDVRNSAFRQTAIAVGDGIKAAMVIAAQLKGNG